MKVCLNHKFDSGSNHLGKAQCTVAIEQIEIYDFVLKDAIVIILKKMTGNIIKSNKCNQCDYASSQAGNLRTHLKKHSGRKPIKCNQCDFVSSHASSLKMHLKTHSGEKSNKCSQCDYASSRADVLRQHLKTHTGEEKSQTNATNVTIHHLEQAI